VRSSASIDCVPGRRQREISRPETHRTIQGKVPTQDEAIRLIRAARGKITEIEPSGHPEGGVSTHTYPHINYTINGAKATVEQPIATP
jgi:hypothetical protein